MTALEMVAYEEAYATALVTVDGDREALEMEGWTDPRDLVDDDENGPLPPAAILTSKLI
jgi:hypothetical protein